MISLYGFPDAQRYEVFYRTYEKNGGKNLSFVCVAVCFCNKLLKIPNLDVIFQESNYPIDVMVNSLEN